MATFSDNSPIDELADQMQGLSVSDDDSTAWMKRLEPSVSGVRATIIDYTLSRARPALGQTPLWAPFDEECIFEGEGDAQYDVYRQMRDVVQRNWATFHPVTNLLVSAQADASALSRQLQLIQTALMQWLHYLVGKLLRCKRLRLPRSAPGMVSKSRSIPQARRQPARIDDPLEQQAHITLVHAELSLAASIARLTSRGVDKGIQAARGRKRDKVESGPAAWTGAHDFVVWWSTLAAAS